jgi:hypothetical protein
LFQGFDAVVRWTLAVQTFRHLGSPFAADTPEQRRIVGIAMMDTESILRNTGLAYLRRVPTQERLEQCLQKKDISAFRPRWFKEGRRTILKERGLAWIYDLIYGPFSGHIHADPGAASFLAGMNKKNLAWLAQVISLMGFWAFSTFIPEITTTVDHQKFLIGIASALQRNRAIDA